MNLLVRNTTLSIPTWNLPATRTCPARTAWCAEHCYACKGQFLYPSVQASHDARWRLTADLDRWVDLMITACAHRRIVRIHSSGDFYSLDYLRAWIDVARNVPRCRFIVYTRVWQLWPDALRELDALPNVVVWASVDPSTTTRPVWPRIAYTGIGVPNCPKQLDGATCRSCMRCADKAQTKVCFKVH